MKPRSHKWRRELSRRLSQQLRADVEEILRRPPSPARGAQRIGITGPPGAGKSSAIAALARRRLARGREVAVLAIDPTSPVTSGSLLGDRIRMDAVAQDERLFIRSVPSGACHDGLCRNVVGLLDILDESGFDDLILETVGVGQVSYEARKLVDTLLLFLVPESGDTVQAMKAGALEMADIYVINKVDLPSAGRLAAELRGVLRLRRPGGWEPPILQVSALTGAGMDVLDDAIDRHREETFTAARRSELERERRAYQLRALLEQRLEELVGQSGPHLLEGNLRDAYRAVLSGLENPLAEPDSERSAPDKAGCPVPQPVGDRY